MNLLRRLRGPHVTGLDADRILAWYYVEPDPQLAADVLERLLSAPASDQIATQSPSVPYLFGRLAAGERTVRDRFDRIWTRRRAAAPAFAAMVRTTMDAGDGAAHTLLTGSVHDPVAIAMLEAEFVLTGDVRPVVKMLEAFELRDILRTRIPQWLDEVTRAQGLSAAQLWIDRLAEHHGLVARLEPPSVVTVSDCDLLLTIRKPINIVIGGQRERRAVPIALSGQDRPVVEAKVAAYASIANLMNDHDRVETAIRAATTQPFPDRVRITLHELLAGFAIPKLRADESLHQLDAILLLDPHRPDLVRLRADIAADPLYPLSTALPRITREG